MSVSGVREIPYIANSPDGITGQVPGASGTVDMELWDENGVVVPLASSGCNQMGDTDFYAWPVSGLALLNSVREFFHWRMTAASGTTAAPEGDVVIFSVEGTGGQMPSLQDPNSYIVQQS